MHIQNKNINIVNVSNGFAQLPIGVQNMQSGLYNQFGFSPYIQPVLNNSQQLTIVNANQQIKQNHFNITFTNFSIIPNMIPFQHLNQQNYINYTLSSNIRNIITYIPQKINLPLLPQQQFQQINPINFNNFICEINPLYSFNNPLLNYIIPQKRQETYQKFESQQEINNLNKIQNKAILKPHKGQKNFKCGHFNKTHYAKGMCNTCYQRFRRNKKPTKCPHKKMYADGRCFSCHSKLKLLRKEKLQKENGIKLQIIELAQTKSQNYCKKDDTDKPISKNSINISDNIIINNTNKNLIAFQNCQKEQEILPIFKKEHKSDEYYQSLMV